MKLKEIISGLPIKKYNAALDDIEVHDIKTVHSEVEKGDIFIALKGTNFDGNDFLQQAFERGAVAAISDKDIDDERVIVANSSRQAYALASKNFFGRACDEMKLIAITGTNGKTTITGTTAEMLRFAGAKVGTIGTLGAVVDSESIDTGMTTPDPYALHAIFKKMKDRGCEFVVMEASAHALALEKLDGVKFEIGLITNITEDHLDFFGDMDNYAKAKFKLFEPDKIKLGIVCGDDPTCTQLLENSKVPVIGYGRNSNFDVSASNEKLSFSGSEFDCNCLGEKTHIKTGLVGEYNIENTLASISILRSLGVPLEMIKLATACISPVEGRFNIIKMGDSNIVIDFAHTPDGLEKVLSTAKKLSDKQLVVIFGCGGNRDKQKRPIMGRIASEIADKVILTSDNPRFENPYSIIGEIKQGMTKDCDIIENRKSAIEYALERYKDGQTIVIAGKGAEKYQEIKGKKYPYNDFDVVHNFFRSKIATIPETKQENHEVEDEKE